MGCFTGCFKSKSDHETTLVKVSSGRFKSRWLRVTARATAKHVTTSLKEVEKEKSECNSIWVAVADDHRETGPIVVALRAKGYLFHHFEDGKLLYYRWVGDPNHDMVPPHMTANEGVGICVLSPDGESILLQWEHGFWKMITGTVETGDSTLGTVRKEVREEMGTELEDNFQFLGGFQVRQNGPAHIMLVFAATAKSLGFQVDNVEISEGQWFPLSSIPHVEENSLDGKEFFAKIEADLGCHGRNFLQFETALFVNVLRQKRSLKAERWSDPRSKKERDIFY